MTAGSCWCSQLQLTASSQRWWCYLSMNSSGADSRVPIVPETGVRLRVDSCRFPVSLKQTGGSHRRVFTFSLRPFRGWGRGLYANESGSLVWRLLAASAFRSQFSGFVSHKGEIIGMRERRMGTTNNGNVEILSYFYQSKLENTCWFI